MQEPRARPRVYVIEQQAYDYAAAEVFGDIVYMNVQRMAPDTPNATSREFNQKIRHQIARELSEYVSGLDFIVPTGAPQKILAVGGHLASIGQWHNVLGWDARQQRYLHYVLPYVA